MGSLDRYWIPLSLIGACLIGAGSYFVCLYFQFADFLTASTKDNPMVAAGGGEEIHQWFTHTALTGSLLSGAVMAVLGLVLAWLLGRLLPNARQWIAGSQDNPAFDSLLLIVGTSVWIVVVTTLSIFATTGSTQQYAREQTFFHSHPPNSD